MKMNEIPVVIPAYEPDERLIDLVIQLQNNELQNIIVINDGSEVKYKYIFEKVRELGVKLLTHEINLGKGRALKDAFLYCINTFPDLIGCVTADSDGQHTPIDIMRCMEELYKNKDLILGVRNFGKKDIPSKSKFGNVLTRKIMKFLYKTDISDTQTGLRGIPADFMSYLLNVNGERFEFETNMLIEARGKANIREIEIETVYDSKENHTTHFRPIADSIKIYMIFFKYILGKPYNFFRRALWGNNKEILKIVIATIYTFCFPMFFNMELGLKYSNGILPLIIFAITYFLFTFFLNLKVSAKHIGAGILSMLLSSAIMIGKDITANRSVDLASMRMFTSIILTAVVFFYGIILSWNVLDKKNKIVWGGYWLQEENKHICMALFNGQLDAKLVGKLSGDLLW